jgi:hypothetical protein
MTQSIPVRGRQFVNTDVCFMVRLVVNYKVAHSLPPLRLRQVGLPHERLKSLANLTDHRLGRSDVQGSSVNVADGGSACRNLKVNARPGLPVRGTLGSDRRTAVPKAGGGARLGC